jgi:pyrroline-5-carboxylate reductase
MKFELGVIGTGEFAVHLLRGFMRHNTDLNVILSPRNLQRAESMASEFGHTVALSNSDVVERANIVLVATLPSQLLDAVSGHNWRDDQTVISVAAGVTLEELNAAIHPATAVLCMPTNSAMIGSSIVPVYPHNAVAEEFLQALGRPQVLQSEQAFESCSVLGATYGWLLALKAASTSWLVENNVAEPEARELMAGLFESVGQISRHRQDTTVDDLANELRLPGGLTEHGLNMFAESASFERWQEVMGSVLDRLSTKY